MKRTSLLPRSFWAVLGLVLGAFALAPASSLAGNAVYTSTDKDAKGCLNGAPDNNINCNIYESKEQVYLSGGPANGSKSLNNGDYFFAILEPGTQQSPIDGVAGNLSSPNDAYAARKFNMTDGVITNLGAHDMGVDKDGRPVIQAMPYDDTTNPGGVYILAVCEWLGEGSANDATNPANCKYDAFKVRESEEPPPGQASDPVVTKDANATFERIFPWSIEKSVACVGGIADQTYDQRVQLLSGSAKCDYTVAVTKGDGEDRAWKVSGTIQVFNSNAGPVTLTDVTDDIGDPNATCTVDKGAGLEVPAEDSLDYPYECVYTDEPDPDNDTNIATAEWDTQTIDIPEPGADIELEGFDGDGTATFAFDGDPDNDNPKLIDNCASVSDLLDAGPADELDAELCESDTFEYTHYFTVPASGCVNHSNKATVTPEDEGAPVDDSTKVRVCGPAADPVVTKDADTSFQRKYPWSLDKSVACVGGTQYSTYDQLVQKLSGSARCDYSVAVTKGAGVDSDWTVTGTIKVANSNDGPVTLSSVTDAIDDAAATCTVDTTAADNDPDEDLVVPANGELEYPYECTYDAAPDPDADTNTATAAWGQQTVATSEGDNLPLAASDDDGTATFGFDDPTTVIDDCAKVTDLLDAGPAVTLQDPLCESKTFQYTKYFAVPASGCQNHSNTATVTPADEGPADTDSTSVRICGPVGGEGTMGFWQNKNGQALIKGSTPNVGECGLTDYLRAYNPFKDLADGSTCKVVAEYATKIIKAASSSGAAMNAMLKAQMLSTALDVYFPSRGVSGAAVMDISAYSAAFGGATSMTVAGMLTYASTQSNSGGTAWYGQNKQTQGKAKDAFDAINNGVALSI